MLTAPRGARAHDGLTLGSVSWSDSGMPTGEWAYENLDVADGKVQVPLDANEAGLVELMSAGQ